MTLSRTNPRAKQRWALLAVAVSVVILVLASAAQGLSQTQFELDKNANDDLTTIHQGTLKGQLSSTTATTFDVCQLLAAPATPFTILIDAEQMTVTAVNTLPANGSTKLGGCSFSNPADVPINVMRYTVVRGVDNVLTPANDPTTAASHPGASDVTILVTGAKAGDDWDDVYASVLADGATETHTCDDVNAQAVACTFIADGGGNSGLVDQEVFTQGGSKDDLNINPLAGEAGGGWRWTQSSVPPSDEILDAFAIKYDTGTRQLLFFGADRWSTNGAKDMGFWLFHDTVSRITDPASPDFGEFAGNHSRPDPGTNGIFCNQAGNTTNPICSPRDSDDIAGDILLLSTFTQGGAVTTIRVFEWVGVGGNTNGTLQSIGAFGDCVPGIASDAGCNTVTNTTVPSPWPYQGAASTDAANVIYTGGMAEGGIDLTALGLEGCFSSFLAETRSSPEPGAQLKDFALGNFESCNTDLTTTPKDGAGNPMGDADADLLPDVRIGTGDAGVDVTDSALLDVKGSTNFTGRLDFFLCGPIAAGTCETGGVAILPSVAANASGTYLSSSANLTSVGRYCWRAEFVVLTGDVPGDTDSSPGECFEVLPVTPTLLTTAVEPLVGLAPTIVSNLADLNGDGAADADDDSTAFYGDTDIIDGALDCNAWGTGPGDENSGAAGDGDITIADDCTLIGYDGTADGVTIDVVDGAFQTADGPLPTVFNAGDPDSADIGDSDFAWSAIFGRVDSNGNEAISGTDCHFGIIGDADILGSDASCGAADPNPALNGLVDLNGDGTITVADTCDTGCFFGRDVYNGLVAAGTVDFGDPVYDAALLLGTAYQPGSTGHAVYPTINANMVTPADGFIAFTLLGPDDGATACAELPLATGTGANPEDVDVTGDGYYRTLGFTPDAPGDYHWKAVYSGDPDGDPDPPLNTLGTSHNDACDEAGEDVTVQQIPTEIKTRQSWYPNDTATITSSVVGDLLEAGGTVDFSLFNNATCDPGEEDVNLLYFEQETLVGGANSEEVGTSNTNFLISTGYDDAADSVAGPYSWLVVYTPLGSDTSHTGIQSACDAEHFSITYTNDPGPGVDLP